MELDVMRAWPIAVQFGGGALLCAIGIWAGLQSGYLDLKTQPDDRWVLRVIAGGFVALLVLACVFTFWLPLVPREVTP